MDQIFDLYNKLIARPNDYAICMDGNPHKRNINLLTNNRKVEIDLFIQHFVKAFRILEPRLAKKRKLVFVKSLGGHIEVKDPDYFQTWTEYQTEIDQVIKHYNFINDIDRDIAAEYEQIENESCKKASNDFEFSQLLNFGITPATGQQLEIGF